MLNRIVIGLFTGIMIAGVAVADNGGGQPQMHPQRQNMMMRGVEPGVMAHHKPMMSPMMRQQNPGPFAGVQFNEEQRKVIQKMMSEERQANLERQHKMQKAQQKLQALYKSEKWDVDAISRVYEELFTEQKSTVEAMAKARNMIFEMLTKEQKSAMKKMQTAQQQRMEQMQQIRRQRQPAPQ